MDHTIFGLIKKRGEIAVQHKVALKAADAFKHDLDAIGPRTGAVWLSGRPKGHRTAYKYKQLFGRYALKLAFSNMLRQSPADDQAVTRVVMDAKGWGEDIYPDVLKRVRNAIKRAQKDGHVVQDFGPDGCLWRLS